MPKSIEGGIQCGYVQCLGNWMCVCGQDLHVFYEDIHLVFKAVFAFAKLFDDAVGAANLRKSRNHKRCAAGRELRALTWRSPASRSADVSFVVPLLSCAAFVPAARRPSPASFC